VPFAYEKLRGIDRDRLLAVVDPVLRAHGLSGVEAIWRTDNRGWVLYLTVERPASVEPGSGVTLDVCSDLSRDLSAALDVADVIEGAYRLEVGSPGVERKLYHPEEYARFAGKLAKLKSRAPIAGQTALRGVLAGTDDEGRILLDTEQGIMALPFEQIESGQLVLDLASMGLGRGKPSGKQARARRAQSKPAGSSKLAGASKPDGQAKLGGPPAADPSRKKRGNSPEATPRVDEDA
jgi:ribosome maturation factor RimP